MSVIPLALNQLSLQELNQLIRIKLLIQVFMKFLVFSLNLQMEGMLVSPPADTHCSHQAQQTVHLNLTVLLREGKDQLNLVSFILVILIFLCFCHEWSAEYAGVTKKLKMNQNMTVKN